MIFIFGLLFIMILLSIGNVTGFYMVRFLDYYSLSIILLSILFYGAVNKMHKTIGRYFINSFKKEYIFSEDELKHLAKDLSDLMKMVLASGVAVFFCGLISMLQNLNDPGLIGPSIAISLLSVFYSVIISFFILYPVKSWAERKKYRSN